MRSSIVQQIDLASESTFAIEGIKKRLHLLQGNLELGILQQYLDQESLSIKQIPKVNIYKNMQ